MSWSWGRYAAGLTGIGLLLLTGCVPARQMAKGTGGEGPRAPAPPEVQERGNATKAKEREASPQPPKVPGPSGYRIKGDDPVVGERITLFEKKKADWYDTGGKLAGLGKGDVWPDSWQECLQDIELTLTGYRNLRTGEEGDLNPWTVLGHDLHYFEKGCDQVLATGRSKLSEPQEPPPPEAALPGGEGDQVRPAFEAGHYQEAVTAYEALVKGLEGKGPPREAQEYYGRALVKLGRLQEATTMLTALMREAGSTPTLPSIELKLLTADLLLAVGQVNEARELYEGVAKVLTPAVSQQAWATANAQAFAEQVDDEDMELYRDLLQAYLRFDGQQVPQPLIDGVNQLQGRPPGPLLDLARQVLTKTTAQAQEWARTQLTEIRALIDNHELVRARELAERMAATAPAEMKPALATLQAEIVQAEAATKENPPLPGEQAPVDPWAEAQHLFEQQKYDEAIARFGTLVDGDRGAEAKAKLAEAAELAAAAMRRQAAALYAKARTIFDPEAKRQALERSAALLRELIEKYPEVSIIAKARQNLKVLEAELGLAQGAPVSVPAPAGKGASDSP